GGGGCCCCFNKQIDRFPAGNYIIFPALVIYFTGNSLHIFRPQRGKRIVPGKNFFLLYFFVGYQFFEINIVTSRLMELAKQDTAANIRAYGSAKGYRTGQLWPCIDGLFHFEHGGFGPE